MLSHRVSLMTVMHAFHEVQMGCANTQGCMYVKLAFSGTLGGARLQGQSRVHQVLLRMLPQHTCNSERMHSMRVNSTSLGWQTWELRN